MLNNAFNIEKVKYDWAYYSEYFMLKGGTMME